jgi:hypothetical protein
LRSNDLCITEFLSFPRKREPTPDFFELLCEPIVFIVKMWVAAFAGMTDFECVRALHGRTNVPANNFKYLAGKLTPVPNDPDAAGWQDNQGDMTNATLHYLRNGTLVELRVTASQRYKNYADIRAKLPKMRRLPL